MKNILRMGLLLLALDLFSCRSIKATENTGPAVFYELWLSRRQPVIPLSFNGVPLRGELVYRTNSLMDAQTWQECLLTQGLVTELRRKGEPAHD